MKILNDAYNIIHINYSYAKIYSKNKKYLLYKVNNQVEKVYHENINKKTLHS